MRKCLNQKHAAAIAMSVVLLLLGGVILRGSLTMNRSILGDNELARLRGGEDFCGGLDTGWRCEIENCTLYVDRIIYTADWYFAIEGELNLINWEYICGVRWKHDPVEMFCLWDGNVIRWGVKVSF